jgi:hypothetical protein
VVIETCAGVCILIKAGHLIAAHGAHQAAGHAAVKHLGHAVTTGAIKGKTARILMKGTVIEISTFGGMTFLRFFTRHLRQRRRFSLSEVRQARDYALQETYTNLGRTLTPQEESELRRLCAAIEA